MFPFFSSPGVHAWELRSIYQAASFTRLLESALAMNEHYPMNIAEVP